MRLKGKIALITGAARGLGRSCAIEFAKQGADLALLDIGSNLEEVPYQLGSGSQLNYTAECCRQHLSTVQCHQVNVTDEKQINAAIDNVIARFGRIDILVNNAGIVSPSGKIIHDVSESEWDTMININLSGVWRMIKAVGPLMSHQRAGSIINIASTAGLVGYRNFAGYVASKHGVIGLTKAAALDYAPLGIRVNAISPGSVRDADHVEGHMLTEIARVLNIPFADHQKTFMAEQPMNMLVEPEDIAHTAVWLASDESCRVTGSVITVDGGFTSR